jgi:hypothetical protein
LKPATMRSDACLPLWRSLSYRCSHDCLSGDRFLTGVPMTVSLAIAFLPVFP